MNSDLLALALLNDMNFTLQEVNNEDAGEAPIDLTKTTSFEILSEQGEVIGFIKTWHDEDDYAGFVHFDSEGNIVDWKAFSKSSSH
ncbi:hypothetical protein CLH62_08880 [Marinobacter guineae]|uniref:Uncharacterized protein n=1 Tax=Marinobacter guineae TaxID=432303 RepID=A0A2G1VGI1_9GAMM|nr:hypothetical protein [Marinobacter guineae]PHQ25710.1 hypothetical protein CLH62_08880 [Marinobacter guineae]